jgi:hypothetical protein
MDISNDFWIDFNIRISIFFKGSKSKTEKLLLENDQQIANEQVYLITLKQ